MGFFFRLALPHETSFQTCFVRMKVERILSITEWQIRNLKWNNLGHGSLQKKRERNLIAFPRSYLSVIRKLLIHRCYPGDGWFPMNRRLQTNKTAHLMDK